MAKTLDVAKNIFLDNKGLEVHDIGNRLDYIQNLLKDKNYNVQIVKEPSLENTALYNLYAQR